MWLYWVEIKHYSALVKNELTVVIKALGLPPHHALVPALFGASTSRYTHESALISGHYTEYVHSRVDTHW